MKNIRSYPVKALSAKYLGEQKFLVTYEVRKGLFKKQIKTNTFKYFPDESLYNVVCLDGDQYYIGVWDTLHYLTPIALMVERAYERITKQI